MIKIRDWTITENVSVANQNDPTEVSTITFKTERYSPQVTIIQVHRILDGYLVNLPGRANAIAIDSLGAVNALLRSFQAPTMRQVFDAFDLANQEHSGLGDDYYFG